MVKMLGELALIQYIQIVTQQKMFSTSGTQNGGELSRRCAETNKTQPQNIQALPVKHLETPIIKVQFGNEIILTISTKSQKRCDLFSWPWREDHHSALNEPTDYASSSMQNSPRSNNNSDQLNLQPSQTGKASCLIQEGNKSSEEILYTENQVGLLKKQLEFKYKGLLSKSTDTDTTLGVPVLFRFKCKNSWNNGCPFQHVLQYCRQENGQIYYRHKSFCSSHTPECTLDDENIQYNVIMRKIDSSMSVLEQIIRKDPLIKPKQILQMFAKQIGEDDDNFLYQDLHTKNIRRSIKKYFDNAVAKVKGRLRHL